MLNHLTIKKKIRTFSVSPENRTGEKGKGGMAIEGSASAAARDLGQGWKVNPYLVIEGGSTCVLADIQGQGAIKHIWVTDSARARALILRIYFDGYENPAVEAPLSDFFATADHREYRQISSLPICVNPNRGLNCYFEMPYFKSFRIEVENTGRISVLSGCIFVVINHTDDSGDHKQYAEQRKDHINGVHRRICVECKVAHAGAHACSSDNP